MGRTNPKLVPFLKQNLEMNCFVNLKYECESIFNIELPRYDKEKCEDFEEILKAWYAFNGKLKKYVGYSNGKSVFQAALKKSVYLMSLPSIGKRLRFRFATSDEVKENKRLLKEKAKSNCQPPSPSNPPSVASSGYLSGNDSEAENLQAIDIPIQDDFLNDILNFPEHYIGDCDNLDYLFKDVDIDSEEVSPFQHIHPDDVVPHQTNQYEDFKPVDEVSQFMNTVTELKTIPVGIFEPVKKYWLCTQKIKVKRTLQLICEMQVIEDGNSGIREGSVVIPNNVFEPGVKYELNKSFELNDLQYYFFSPNSA